MDLVQTRVIGDSLPPFSSFDDAWSGYVILSNFALVRIGYQWIRISLGVARPRSLESCSPRIERKVDA